ncbi:unnamed protein product, partial [Hapterophycus canaliculatus]
MALEREGECHIVEGYVVEHSLLLKSRSVGYLSEMGAADEATTTTTATRRPPKISVTLSEYLSAASPNPDPSCDFGWFTPTASASSLAPAAGDCQEGFFAAPSPSSHHPTSFLFPSTSAESAANTVSMSPEPIVLGNGGGREKSLQSSCNTSAAPVPARAAVADNSGCGGGPRQVSFRGNGAISQEPGSWALPKDQNRRQRGAALGSSAAGYETSSAAGDGGDGSLGEGGMGVRLLPVAHSRSTTAHLNSWHTLYPHVSDRRKLASVLLGRCTLHLRRTCFPISTRHFPEKPPTPRMRALGSGRNASASSCCRSSRSSSSSSSSSSNGKVEGAGCKVSNGPPPLRGSAGGAAISLQQQQQQQQQQRRDCGVEDSRDESCSWAITEIRVVRPPVGAPFAQYLVVVCMGREKLVAGWRRASDFEKLAWVARRAWMSQACMAWEALERARRNTGGGPCSIPLVLRPRRLDAVYLQNKVR